MSCSLYTIIFLFFFFFFQAEDGIRDIGWSSDVCSSDLAAAAARGPDVALDRALKELVRMDGGPPGTIAVVQRGQHREVHTFGVANHETKRRMRVDDRMRIASTAKAFSGAVALSLVSKGALSLDRKSTRLNSSHANIS